MKAPASGRHAAAYNELLRNAIVEAWDGSEEHGRALLVVIKGLKELRERPSQEAGAAHFARGAQ
jgi:isoaspartyl peptidase/L-asparaginase-like protein (Ntn-hydrolase superfamily)